MVRAAAPLPKATIQNLQWVAAQAGHELHVDGNLWRCVHCLRSSAKSGLRKLAAQPCEVVERRFDHRCKSPPRSGGRKDFWRASKRLVSKHSTKRDLREQSSVKRSFDGQLGTGRAKLHPSHNLAGTRGFVWCWKCGSYATRVPRLLAEPCRGTSRASGKAILQRIRAGKTPLPRMHRWPCPDSTLEGNLTVS